MKATGERVFTAEGGFNPTWQRHVAGYVAAAELLPECDGPVLDLGCGVGHSYDLLAPRETIGVDLDAEALDGQDRETHVADMRELPFEAGTFAAVVSVQSIEHVPDPERVVAEVVRLLEPGGTAIFITPNRLTFARPDEIIDPYHYVEYDAPALDALCQAYFDAVELLGLFGSQRYRAIVADQQARLEALLRRDPLRLRRLIPRRARRRLYDDRLAHERRSEDPRAAAIGAEDFELRQGPLEACVDLVALCRASPHGPTSPQP